MARKKTPAQIEKQYRDLMMEQYHRNPLSMGLRITNAVKSVRAQNGYTSTGKRTRYMDEIFQRSNGKLFTVQGDKEVTYRPKNNSNFVSDRNKQTAVAGIVAG